MVGSISERKAIEEKVFDAKKFVKEWIEYKESQAWWKEFEWSIEYYKDRDEIMETLKDQNKLKELLENLQNKKPIIPIIFGLEVKEYADTPEDLKRRETAVRAMLAEDLTIKSDMPNELVEIAFLLAGDENWNVKRSIAGNTDIMPDVFAKLAEKLKNEEDWRVVFELLSNPNTPKEIVNEIEEKYKSFLKVYKAFEELESLSKQLSEELIRSLLSALRRN